ncbi:Uma2 family endonuclease [Phytohabitans rumicis]|uniref:Uma2 family endonuclease n=1 Tax=Phytohabitans rumicis TaxID=1076125 RepID=UPI0015649C4E|nr:Uma2 family endonuclease [Phytohabitans rumicis]
MVTLHLPAVEVWTVDAIKDLPPELRYELHDGSLLIMSPARFWHQEIERRICNLLRAANRIASQQVGVLNTVRDTRVPDVAVFNAEPEDWDVTWHLAAAIALVVEVWSPGSDGKDRDTQWYAERGIPGYWLAEPIEGDKKNALITMHELKADANTYVVTSQATLAELEERGLS